MNYVVQMTYCPDGVDIMYGIIKTIYAFDLSEAKKHKSVLITLYPDCKVSIRKFVEVE